MSLAPPSPAIPGLRRGEERTARRSRRRSRSRGDFTQGSVLWRFLNRRAMRGARGACARNWPVQAQKNGTTPYFPRGALGLRRGFGAPERGQIVRHIADRGQVGRGGSLLARPLDALILRLETGLFGQGLLPVSLERARHQPVLGLHGGILPARALDLVACALQPLSPMATGWRTIKPTSSAGCSP
jgi:hypothetical protein